jgi:enamine deaminase RidA (YjgF/YER057c/UK114 family)
VSPRKFVSSGSPWEALAGYSRAVVDGRWVFVSGTVGYDLRTNTWPPTAQAQAEMSLDIIERALRDAGAALLDVARVRAFVPDRADVEAVSGVLKKRLGAARAANTTVCSPLAVDTAKVEIEVTALKGQDRRAASIAGRAASRAPSRSRARRRPR